MRAINCQVLMGVAGMVSMMLNCDWMPRILKPFISGLFLPLILITFLNYNILVGFDDDSTRTANIYIMIAPIILFALTAVRTSGSHSTK